MVDKRKSHIMWTCIGGLLGYAVVALAVVVYLLVHYFLWGRALTSEVAEETRLRQLAGEIADSQRDPEDRAPVMHCEYIRPIDDAMQTGSPGRARSRESIGDSQRDGPHGPPPF
jgi:hypothetical protein